MMDSEKVKQFLIDFINAVQDDYFIDPQAVDLGAMMREAINILGDDVKSQFIEGIEYEVYYQNSGQVKDGDEIKIDGIGYEILDHRESGDGWQLGKDLFKQPEK